MSEGFAQRAVEEDGGEPGGVEKRVALAQRHFERARQMQDHVARRRGAPALDEADMLLGASGLEREFELAHAPFLRRAKHFSDEGDRLAHCSSLALGW